MNGQDIAPYPKGIEEEETQAEERLLPLINQVWLRLGGGQQAKWSNRTLFLAAADEGMRRILIDNARRKPEVHSGEALARISADATGFDVVLSHGNDQENLLVNETIAGLAAHDPSKTERVKQRQFAGQTLEVPAEVLGMSHRTAKRDCAYT